MISPVLSFASIACSPGDFYQTKKSLCIWIYKRTSVLCNIEFYWDKDRHRCSRFLKQVIKFVSMKQVHKSLLLYPGKNISYQVHGHRDDVSTFVDGEGLLVLDGVVRKVSRGDVVHIAKGHKHALRAITELQLVEVQTGDLLEETDITRFPWEW